MKLNPPASSSDIEVARDIARRLHQRRRREDRPSGGRRALDADRPPAALAPEPPMAAHAPSPPPWEPPAAPPPILEPPVEEPAPPSWDDAPPDDAGDVNEPEDALEALTAEAPPASDPGLAGVSPIELEEPPAPVAAPKAAFEEADAYGGTPEASPFDGGDALVAPDIEPAGLEGSDEASDEEELFDGPPQPSWGDIIERCMALAHARGALLADPSGALVAVRGEWPDPGPDAIASRLVAMMERTLRDAPTRSVSAPVGGMHLTAWRVPAGELLLTAAFIAETLVKSDTRPAIDDEVRRGAA